MKTLRGRTITPEQFRDLADAAVSAVGWTEGWCDTHASWVIDKRDGALVGASPTFRANFRKALRDRGVVITRPPKALLKGDE